MRIEQLASAAGRQALEEARRPRARGRVKGKTAGRGHKGAKSRSGFKHKRGFEGGQMPLHRRVPKRGFHNPFRSRSTDVVNLDSIAERFDAGAEITPELLRERGLVGAAGRVKVLARGDIAKALTIRAHKFSGKRGRENRRGRREGRGI